MPKHFIADRIEQDLALGRVKTVRTRFPPEPNGYLHLGHAKSICLNFSLAAEYGGTCNLRFDDTNPLAEDQEYVDAIERDVRWLGFDWQDRKYFASDYFDQLYEWAEQLVQAGKAYVDDLSVEELRALRGPWTEPGKESPYRHRTVEENLDLLRRMKNGEFPDGSRVLRAKIDMSSGNVNLRDPVMYRILHVPHHRTGDRWCIYPTYDWAHGQSDSIEGITHSICTLEFEDHRPLYEWFLRELGIFPSQQIEFARLNLSHTVLSKRKLLRLVEEGVVSGWDDPRMPTLAGARRRGYPPEAIRDFCERIGVTKQESVVEYALLEHCVREYLNRTAPRRMAVLDPLKLTLVDWPVGHIEEVEAVNNPEDPGAGTRKLSFGREVWIERSDFLQEPPKGFHRLAPGREVRLRWAYVVRCVGVVKDATGRIVEVQVTHDPATRGGGTPDGRKVPGTIHWVHVPDAVPAEVRLYDHLFSNPDPDAVPEGVDWIQTVNPRSLVVIPEAWVEPALTAAAPQEQFQFERLGYFVADSVDHRPDRLVFNRTVTLRDAWSRKAPRGGS